ncbi:head-tail joining protein [Sphingomonas sp. Leaf257]|uniref:head-tail joining protein n=1 Tax=Sphingomonas sp. Leaf257 TaxID=1736309 RepID=UPI0006F1FE99|nr:hypothetical protein [Sphingomonas sp. Leaf257]KQO50643.1 hypothetical protein ASF14_11205 [Sphingomonas sp. Leaf257]
MDPFVAALDAQFHAPGSAAAVYVPASGAPYAVRAILGGKDEEQPLGAGVIIVRVTVIQLLRTQVPEPEQGAFAVLGGVIVDGEVVGGDVYELTGEPMIDVERLSWTIGAEPSDASALP